MVGRPVSTFRRPDLTGTRESEPSCTLWNVATLLQLEKHRKVHQPRQESTTLPVAEVKQLAPQLLAGLVRLSGRDRRVVVVVSEVHHRAKRHEGIFPLQTRCQFQIPLLKTKVAGQKCERRG